MIENQEENIEVSGMDSKFMRVFLIIIGALLVFMGPTYVPYILARVLNLNLLAANVVGIALFIVGILMIIYLARKKILS
jgi:cytochrome c biogenesis protein CcdA